MAQLAVVVHFKSSLSLDLKKVIFRAIRGFTWSSDIAFDEVSLKKGSCGRSGLANNITPWKTYGQDIIKSMPLPDVGVSTSISINPFTTPTTSTTLLTTVPLPVRAIFQRLQTQNHGGQTNQQEVKPQPKLRFCNQENNILFNPTKEACCGGKVKEKHPWLRCCQSGPGVPEFYSVQVKGCCADSGLFYKREFKCCHGYLVDPSVCDV